MKLPRSAIAAFWMLILLAPIVGVELTGRVPRAVAYGACGLVAAIAMLVALMARRAALRRIDRDLSRGMRG